jgi:site-specific DNA-methyltransferase (adenine-specific)
MLQENMGRKEVRSHPNQKPLAVIKWVLSLAPDSPQTVLDPFMGSGTTLRAAKDLGRKAIGIEIEEKYCEIAANRLRQEVLQFG